jgi:hypothetical protein
MDILIVVIVGAYVTRKWLYPLALHMWRHTIMYRISHDTVQTVINTGTVPCNLCAREIATIAMPSYDGYHTVAVCQTCATKLGYVDNAPIKPKKSDYTVFKGGER